MSEHPLNGNSTQQTPALQPLAIIGIACRYPGGADSPESFWALLKDEVDAIGEIPANRLDIEHYYGTDRQPGKIITREGGFLADIDKFDPGFFGISPREAAYMDPQQRLLLEVAWEALESAGQVPANLAGSNTGVFVGIWSSEYEAQMFAASDDIHFHVMLGGARYPAAGRVSYAFDFRGPSMIVDTACSSSLVAVHLACQSLWTDEATMALAGGINVIIEPEGSIGGSQSGMLSADGRCRFGDAKASGYVRSEGVGMVVIKPLTQALADKDPVFAVIRGSAVNSDGRSGGVISAPGHEAQVAAMRQAYRRAGVLPRQIGYVEAHGTGTPTGDPVEVKALATVLGEGRPADSPCFLGSVKTNIGHTEPASGVAGLIKAALCLKHRAIPASLHFQEPNPNIPWAELPLVMQTSYRQWPEGSEPAFACVNSFGITGTNAHLILEEPQRYVPDGHALTTLPPPYLVPLSAHTPEALQKRIQACARLVKSNEDTESFLHNFGYTSARRRPHHAHRAAFTCESTSHLLEQMESALQGKTYNGISLGTALPDKPLKVAFVFSGMGPQWWGMGRELLAQEPVFRQAIEKCDDFLAPYTNWSLIDELRASEETSRMEQADVAQPANFALQVGLLALWQSWGIQPAAVIGHSAGEVAAAYAAGILSFADAVKVIYHRSRLQYRTTGEGKMLAVGLPYQDIDVYLADRHDNVSLAAVNSPTSLTLSGDAHVLGEIEKTLKAQGVFARFLQTDIPYHSPKMDPLQEELLSGLQDITCHPPQVPAYTTVTGELANKQAFGAYYWWQNVRQPVLFAQAITQMMADGYTNYVELSPHPVLARSVQECFQQTASQVLMFPSLRRQQPERPQMLYTLAELYTQGAHVNWDHIYTDGECIALPTYPWHYRQLWFQDGRIEGRARPYKQARRAGVSGSTLPFWGSYVRPATLPNAHVWQFEVNASLYPYLDDHRVRDRVIFPAAGYIGAILGAANKGLGTEWSRIEEIRFEQALLLPDDASRTMQMLITPNGGSAYTFQILSQEHQEAHWTQHVRGHVATNQASLALPGMQCLSVEQAQAQSWMHKSGQAHYQQMQQVGLDYGRSFQGVQHIWHLPDRYTVGQLGIPGDLLAEASQYHIHPSLLDSAFQVLLSTIFDNASLSSQDVYLPVQLDALRFYEHIEAETYLCTAHLLSAQSDNNEMMVGDILLSDVEGRKILEIQGLRCQRVKRSKGYLLAHWLYRFDWQLAQNRPALPRSSAETTEQAKWLIFADNDGFGEQLAHVMDKQKVPCILVKASLSAYGREGRDTYHIDPTNSEHFHTLVTEAFISQAMLCKGVIYAWGTGHQVPISLDGLRETQHLTSEGILHFLQAGTQLQWTETPRLWLVTNKAQAVTAVDTLQLQQSHLWGLWRVMALENPTWRCVAIDLDTSDNTALDNLAAELLAADGETQIAYRHGQRYCGRLDAYRPRLTEQETNISADGTYLITGGLGALGLEVAQWLVRQGAKHLILTGRSGISNERQQQAVEQMRGQNAQIVVAEADISQLTEVAQLLRQAAADMPAIRGIIHSAGVLDDGVLLQQSWPRFRRVMAPKVDGAWHLHEQTQGLELDFFVVFSSLASMLGSLGQSNYAAANAFMDALMAHRRAQGLPGLSVGWGPWADIGMAAHGSDRDKMRWQSAGVYPIAPEEGLLILEALLQDVSMAQVGVFRIDWARYLAQFTSGLPLSLAAFTGEENEADANLAEAGAFRLQLETAPISERQELLIEHVHATFIQTLGLHPSERIGLRQPFFDLGVDSLVALEILNHLQKSLQCSLPATFLFDYPTLESLVHYLGNTMGVFESLETLPAEPPDQPEPPDQLLAEVDNLSDEEAASLLLRTLDRMNF